MWFITYGKKKNKGRSNRIKQYCDGKGAMLVPMLFEISMENMNMVHRKKLCIKPDWEPEEEIFL